MSRAQVINHKGKSIYFMDFSGLKKQDEIEKLIEEAKSYIRKQPAGSLYTLTNISDMHFNTQIKEKFTDFAKGNKEYVKAGSVVGISGMQTIMYNAVMRLSGRNLKAISSVDQAKEWLALQN